MKTKFLMPALAVVLVLLYVPHAATSAQRGAHKLGVFLTEHRARGSVTSWTG